MGRAVGDATSDPGWLSDRGPYRLHAVTSGSGPPLVLIHGVAGSNMIWDRMVPLLEPHFTVVRLDLLGYGHSPKPWLTYTPRRHVAAIRFTLAQEGVARPYAFVGLSMGTVLMLEYAAQWPDEAQEMIGIAFPYFPSERAARAGLRHNVWTRLALEHRFTAGVMVPTLWWAGRLAPGLISRTSSIYTRAMAKDALRTRYRAFRSSLLNCMVDHRLDEPLAASGGARRLFIHGGADEWVTVEAVREAVSLYELSILRVIRDGPHNLAVAEPERVAALIFDHLGVTKPRPQG